MKESREHPDRIYLEPYPGTEYTTAFHEGPCWCEDQIEPDWTEYVRADQVEGLKAERDRLRKVTREIMAATSPLNEYPKPLNVIADIHGGAEEALREGPA